MLFTSSKFLFGFLPVTWVVFRLAARFSSRLATAWLALASVIFYGWWDVRYVPLLVGSVVFNFGAGEAIRASRARPAAGRALLTGAISANILALVYFKYLSAVCGFLIAQGLPIADPGEITLPLGISFFTFTQIAYLLDVAWGMADERDPVSYALFVTFFPHLLAGPILHHAEVMPQFQRSEGYRFRGVDLAIGTGIFIMGLAKKTLIADPISLAVGWGFSHPEEVRFFTAWQAALSYSLQLYFDFSGYSDMAIGMARMFGVRFPLNFNSPYKAASVIEYWQRWHMTLTRYLTQYVFNPISLAIMHAISARRRREGRRMSRADRLIGMVLIPMMTTMTIAGIWHGAGLQFVVFGVLHGVYLSINHAWRIYRPASGPPSPGWRMASCLLTYLAVLVGAVFFRAASVPDAVRLLSAMIGLHGAEGPVPLPDFLLDGLGPVGRFLTSHGLIASTNVWGSALTGLWVIWMASLYVIVWFLPNTQQIFGRYRPALGWSPEVGRIAWGYRMTAGWGVIIGILWTLTYLLPQQAEFIYFRF